MAFPSNGYIIFPDSAVEEAIRSGFMNQLPENSFCLINNAINQAFFSENLVVKPALPFLPNSMSELVLNRPMPYWSHQKTALHSFEKQFCQRFSQNHIPKPRYKSRVCPFCEKTMTTKHYKRHVERFCSVAKMHASQGDRKLAALKGNSIDDHRKNKLIDAVGVNVARELRENLNKPFNRPTVEEISTQKRTACSKTDREVPHLAISFLQGYTYSWLPETKAKSKRAQKSALLTILNLARCNKLSQMNFKFWDAFFNTNRVIERVRQSRKGGVTTVARRMQYQRCKALLDFTQWLFSNEHMKQSAVLISLFTTVTSRLLRSCKHESGIKKTKRSKFEHSIVLPQLYSSFLDKHIAENGNARNIYGLRLARICVAINGLTGCR